MKKPPKIAEFNFPEGKVLCRKYHILAKLGGGLEGEVYLVREISTGIERAAKFFYPHYNLKNKTANMQAQKLHKLRQCSMIIGYHAQEVIQFQKQPVTCLVSEFVKGELLSQYISRQPGKRLNSFQGIHLLHALASGVEEIHRKKDYHGDLHTDNIIIQRVGLRYHLKLVDFFHWEIPKRKVIQEEIRDMIGIFHEALGGAKHYHKQPKEVKGICLGLKKTLIAKKFRSANQLKIYLEAMEWE